MTNSATLLVTTPSPSDKSSIHFSTIKSKIPEWLVTSPPEILRALRNSIEMPLPGFERSYREMPEIARQLQLEHARHRTHEKQLGSVRERLAAVDVFAEPLLTEAIEARFGLKVDVRRTFLFHARRAQVDQSFAGASADPLVALQKALKGASQTLLSAALQNFEAAEAEPGGMDQDERRKAAVYRDDPVKGIAVTGEVVDIAAHEFAALCRELDLGGKYQALIETTFNPPSAPGDAADAAAYALQGQMKSAQQSAFVWHVHLAYLKKQIGTAMYQMLLEVAQNKAVHRDGSRVTCSFLQLWQIDLTAIVVIGKDREAASQAQPVAVYIPGDPVSPLKEYASTLEFAKSLRERMLLEGYLDFFQRFIPARHRSELSSKLLDTLRPLTWNEQKRWRERQTDNNAKLHLRERAFTGSFLSELVRQKIQILKVDALFHAVPTAVEDQKTFDERVQYFQASILQALNIAAFFVPGLGETMLAVTALQLGYETYEGLESWTRGEQEQAWSYLLDVVENIALIAALAATGGEGAIPASERIPVETPSFIEDLGPVELPDGSTRLWKPDLAPFAHDVILPAGLQPDELGLYHYQGKTWLALEDKVYSVKQAPGQAGYRLEHPTRSAAYEPSVRHNDAGAWQHELERPQQWEGLTLFRRLGHYASAFSDVDAQRILWVSDTREAVLRQALSENQRPPALLQDTLQRFSLDRQLVQATLDDPAARTTQFETRYQALSLSMDPATLPITRIYPGLPTVIADELVRHASGMELQQLAQGKVPARIAEEIRSYQQQVRLARACEGLYLESVSNPDSDKLILHTLPRLEGWSPEVRLEVRDGSFRGVRIDSVGADDAPIRKVLVRHPDGYETYDAHGLSLHGRDTLYAAVMHALPDAQRAALGIPNAWDAPALKRKVQQQDLLPRQSLRRLLQMQPSKPASRSPMRLADGRVGYPLSGRGALGAYITRDTLLDMIRWIGLQDPTLQSAEEVLGALEAAGLRREQIHIRLTELLTEQQSLTAALDSWGDTSASLADLTERAASRAHIHDAIWQHWFDNNLPEIGRSTAPLRLRRLYLIDFPEHLPDFVYQRTHHLQLLDMSIGTWPATFDNWNNDANALRTFSRPFNQVTALQIGLAPRLPHLLYGASTQLWTIASYFPSLRALSVADQNLALNSINVRTLTHLERLDLSGNTVDLLLASPLGGLRLRYLGLDRTGLDFWPDWLDSQALHSIEEVSLRDNRITALPEFLLRNETASDQRTVIALEGNSLLPTHLIRIRLDQGTANNRFVFELDFPPALQAQLDTRLQERTVLREALDSWAHASSSTGTLSATTVQARGRISEAILQFWRAYSEGKTFSPLHLEDVAMVDFPTHLPAFFHAQVRNLSLVRVDADVAALDAFLRPFRQLTELTLEGHVQPMTALPPALLELPELETLSLQDQGLLVDQDAMTLFGQMSSLSSLDLSGNRFGEITHVAALGRHLNRLYLANTGLQHWPAWLDNLLPLGSLVLDDNAIIELPEHILYNPRNDDAVTEISLLGNPLDYHVMLRAHVSEGYNRSFTFDMDLPDDIRALDQEGHESDSGSSGHGHSPAPSSDEEAPDVEQWLLGTPEENQTHRTVWAQLEDAQDAGNLLDLVGRLTQTAPYRTARTRADFSERVWRVLEVAAQDTASRGLFNGMAEEALVQADTGDQTCHDGAWLVFNQIEIQVFTEQSLKDVPEALRGQTLYRLTLRLYRLHELDVIAREQAGTRDEAEVRLAYRLRWAQELDLPLAPASMLYQAHASIRPGELETALARVQQGENGEAFIRYAGERDFWVAYLREAYPARFAALEQAYQERVLAVPDRFPGRSIDELAEEYAALERQFESETQHLVRQLTIEEGAALL
ncbi:hypothetical protein PS910_01255 [Pseudomonas fluorescens]|nr:hypothetical protein PS910_01255 [Pseudomonas fluorescens]